MFTWMVNRLKCWRYGCVVPVDLDKLTSDDAPVTFSCKRCGKYYTHTAEEWRIGMMPSDEEITQALLYRCLETGNCVIANRRVDGSVQIDEVPERE